MNTNEGHITSSYRTSQSLDRKEGCNKGQEKPNDREKTKTLWDKYEDGNITDIAKNERKVKGEEQGSPKDENSLGSNTRKGVLDQESENISNKESKNT
jgi:hypothetical protein